MSTIKIQNLNAQRIKVPERNFTGDVMISNFIERPMPSNVVSANVFFSPGSRTPWKFNALGQTLIITAGKGWAQCKEEAIVALKEGDTVWCPPGIWHWDGASDENPMSYIAVYEGSDGKIVHFGEKVTDEEFSIAVASHEKL